jgi:hypothetical protein
MEACGRVVIELDELFNDALDDEADDTVTPTVVVMMLADFGAGADSLRTLHNGQVCATQNTSGFALHREIRS